MRIFKIKFIYNAFYFLWIPFHIVYLPFFNLRKRSRAKWLTRKLEKRKDCYVKFGKDINLYLDVNVLVHANSRMTIGNKCTIMDGSRIAAKNGGKLSIGNNSLIGRYCIVSCWHKIIIEDNVLFSNMIWVTDHQHKFDLTKQVDFSNCDNFATVRIKSGTWIGNKVTIMQGVTIGKNCVIGANSVVTKSIPDGCVAVGVPARIIKTADDLKKAI